MHNQRLVNARAGVGESYHRNAADDMEPVKDAENGDADAENGETVAITLLYPRKPRLRDVGNLGVNHRTRYHRFHRWCIDLTGRFSALSESRHHLRLWQKGVG